MIQQIDHIEVVTEDLEKSIEFYTHVLGFKLARRISYGSEENARQIAYVTLGNVALELQGPVKRRPDQGDPADSGRVGVRLVALRVDDMMKTLEYLKSKGIEASSGPNPGGSFYGLRAEIKDPNGIAIELREWQENDSLSSPHWQPTRPGIIKIA